MRSMLLRRQFSLQSAAMVEPPLLALDGDELGRLPAPPEEDGAAVAAVIRRMLTVGLGMAGTILALLLAWVVIG